LNLLDATTKLALVLGCIGARLIVSIFSGVTGVFPSLEGAENFWQTLPQFSAVSKG